MEENTLWERERERVRQIYEGNESKQYTCNTHKIYEKEIR